MCDLQGLQRAINEAINARIPTCAWDSTVAIVIAQEPVVRQHGTGILFRIAEDSFVVTAGHVVKQAEKYGYTLGISSSNGSFVAVPGQWFHTSEGQYGVAGDVFDVAVHRLSQAAVEKLGKKEFVQLDDIDFDPQSPTAVYALFGYPAVWSRPSTNDLKKLIVKALQYVAFRYDGGTDDLPGYDERFHLLIDAQQRYLSSDTGLPISFQNMEGVAKAFPSDLGGISGCSVWRVGDYKMPVADWGRERSRIVAVQTSVYPKAHVIKATLWIAVSTLLHGAYPELRPSIELWRPR